MKPVPHDAYQPLSRRRRWLIVLLAMATAITVLLVLLKPPGGVQRPHGLGTALLPRGDAAPRCAPGQTQGCVGGTAQVIVPARPVAGPPGPATAPPRP